MNEWKDPMSPLAWGLIIFGIVMIVVFLTISILAHV